MPELTQSSRVVKFGPFEADLHTRELRKHGLRIKLQEQPFQVLAMLLERPGDLVTREEIRAKLWPEDTFVDFDHGLNAAIRRLRDALNDSADTPRFVETLPRRGYRFIGQVERTSVSAPEVRTSVPGIPSSAPISVTERAYRVPPEDDITAKPPLVVARRRSRIGTIVVLAMAGLIVVGALLAWKFWLHSDSINSIAVLPFVNQTSDSNLDYLTDGITESIINNLAQVPTLKVTSRNAAFVYKGRATDTKAIARDLGVRAVMIGTVSAVPPTPGVSPAADDVRLDLELVDTQDDRRLWGEHYTIKKIESNDLLYQISDRVADKLALRLSPAIRSRVARRHTDNNWAFDAYLHGMFAINQRGGVDDYRQALGYFRDSLSFDQKYALAYTGEAAALGLLAFYGGMAPKEAYPLEEAATHRALALDPDLADAHIQDGYLLQTYHRDLTGAEREYLRAIQLEPYSGQAHHALALHMAITGRVDESLAEARRAAELEPTLPPSKGSILWNQYFGHRFSDMELSLKTLSGNFSPCMEALAAEAVGNYAQAASAAAQVEQANWSPGYLCSLPEIYAVTGHAADARKILDQMIRDRSKTYISAYQIALVYAGLHETQPMLHWLQVADDEDDPWMLWLKQDPRFDKYRSLPAFAVIEQRAFTPR